MILFSLTIYLSSLFTLVYLIFFCECEDQLWRLHYFLLTSSGVFKFFISLARIFSRHLLSKVFVLTFLQFPWIYVSGWTSWFFPCSSIFLRCLSVFITLCKKKENSVANQAGFYLKTFFLSGAIFTKFAIC